MGLGRALALLLAGPALSTVAGTLYDAIIGASTAPVDSGTVSPAQ
jgi:hypothetical protein